MLHIVSFAFNALSENTYLIINEQKQCWIVDPGMYDPSETKFFLDYITKEQLIPQAIINTHTHFDHIFGVHDLVAAYQIPFGIHEKDMIVLEGGRSSAIMFGFDLKPAKHTFLIPENVPLQLGNDTLEVRFTPGHSPGSISFYDKAGNWVIGGDVLFAGGIGRTDLPGGDYETLMHSIQSQLMVLPEDTIVHPGHGPATTIGREKAGNPFLQ